MSPLSPTKRKYLHLKSLIFKVNIAQLSYCCYQVVKSSDGNWRRREPWRPAETQHLEGRLPLQKLQSAAQNFSAPSLCHPL